MEYSLSQIASMSLSCIISFEVNNIYLFTFLFGSFLFKFITFICSRSCLGIIYLVYSFWSSCFELYSIYLSFLISVGFFHSCNMLSHFILTGLNWNWSPNFCNTIFDKMLILNIYIYQYLLCNQHMYAVITIFKTKPNF